MPRIEIRTLIHAPIHTVFDLARSIDVHQQSQARHGEHAIGGRTTGLIELHESVTWEAVHFGIRQRLTSRIVAFQRPTHFRDSMIEGAFARFDHDHLFSVPAEGQTLMTDVFDYTAPLGGLGKFADWIFLRRYMETLLSDRNLALKAIAESDEYRPSIEQETLRD